jgi:hypothetical protein
MLSFNSPTYVPLSFVSGSGHSRSVRQQEIAPMKMQGMEVRKKRVCAWERVRIGVVKRPSFNYTVRTARHADKYQNIRVLISVAGNSIRWSRARRVTIKSFSQSRCPASQCRGLFPKSLAALGGCRETERDRGPRKIGSPAIGDK